MPSELKALSEAQAHEIVDKIEKEIRTANFFDRDLKFIFPAGAIADTLRLAWNRRADDPIVKELVGVSHGLQSVYDNCFDENTCEKLRWVMDRISAIFSRLEAREETAGDGVMSFGPYLIGVDTDGDNITYAVRRRNEDGSVTTIDNYRTRKDGK